MTARLLRVAALAGALAALAGAAQAAECFGTPTGVRATVVIDGVRSSQGLMAVTIYREKGFLKKGGSIKVWREAAHAPGQTMCVWLPGPGSYAIGVYQDKDSNHKIAYNLTGPTEPWGFSGNPKALFGLPKFKQVRFEAAEGANVTLAVHLNN